VILFFLMALVLVINGFNMFTYFQMKSSHPLINSLDLPLLINVGFFILNLWILLSYLKFHWGTKRLREIGVEKVHIFDRSWKGRVPQEFHEDVRQAVHAERVFWASVSIVFCAALAVEYQEALDSKVLVHGALLFCLAGIFVTTFFRGENLRKLSSVDRELLSDKSFFRAMVSDEWKKEVPLDLHGSFRSYLRWRLWTLLFAGLLFAGIFLKGT